MNTHNLREKGYSVTWVILLLLVLGIVGFVGWKVFTKEGSKNNTASNTVGNSEADEPATFVRWQFNDVEWAPMGAVPDCEEPLAIGDPMDMSKATSKLYPGQVRGSDFKPHGGIGVDDAPTNDLAVYAIRDAWVYQGSRYIEGGIVQYMFDFMDSCGIRYRFDHLTTLTDEMMQIANKLPEPKQDDSRTYNLDPVFIKQGTVVATQVNRPGNVFFDLGVYDLRQPNEASKTDLYKTDQRRIGDREQSFYAVCWFDLLSDKSKAIVDGLPSRSGSEGTSSDYCEVR